MAMHVEGITVSDILTARSRGDADGVVRIFKVARDGVVARSGDASGRQQQEQTGHFGTNSPNFGS